MNSYTQFIIFHDDEWCCNILAESPFEAAFIFCQYNGFSGRDGLEKFEVIDADGNTWKAVRKFSKPLGIEPESLVLELQVIEYIRNSSGDNADD